MSCKSLRKRYYEGDDTPFREHVSDCDKCRRWLRQEMKLVELLATFHADVSEKVMPLAGKLTRPDRRAGHLSWILIPLAAAAAVILTVGMLLRGGGEQGPELLPTRIVVISGRVRDDVMTTEFIEVDGKRYPVTRVSATEGLWEVEVVLEGKQRDIVLSAIDASGNRRVMNVHLQR